MRGECPAKARDQALNGLFCSKTGEQADQLLHRFETVQCVEAPVFIEFPIGERILRFSRWQNFGSLRLFFNALQFVSYRVSNARRFLVLSRPDTVRLCSRSASTFAGS